MVVYDELRKQNDIEAVERARSVDGAAAHAWQYDRGISNGQGWIFQGFIEVGDGSLRPQSFDESLSCVGCHGGIGATTDSVFSLPRKLDGDVPAHGLVSPNRARSARYPGAGEARGGL
jgi:hypothetical protein